MLKGKKILLGVTGSIAAYKAAILIRLLVKEGAEVKVVMTELAKEFITPLTLATLAKNPVLVDFFNPENGDWNSHVDLGIWADAYLIAPATANTIGKMTHGIADNLLLTSYLSARCPVFIAPAMDLDMFRHIATQANLKILSTRGNIILQPSTGELASGLEGKGRMKEPEEILDSLLSYFENENSKKKNSRHLKLENKKVLITAGPTQEPIDPVRYISNHSTGKMAYALAESFITKGAEVYLVTGPTSIEVPSGVKECIKVNTADEMYISSTRLFPDMDITILAAAVADYRSDVKAQEKIKSSGKTLNLPLVKTVDIAQKLGESKKSKQLIVGFALETENELENAKIKLKKKNLDFIVLNSLKDEGAGFGFDTNKITILDKDNKIYNFGLKSKSLVAQDILSVILEKV